MKIVTYLTGFLIIALFMLIAPIRAQTIRTVGTSGNYTTLKAAFDAINAGGITGNIELRIISSTTETATASLNASGSGSASYLSVTVYPVGSGYSISGNINGALINLNGARNVTFDGRVNMAGTSQNLTIINNSTGTNAANAAIRFISSAQNNVFRYCVLRASGASTSTGIILFSTATSGTGNSNNMIEFCNITNAGGNRTVNVIYSAGTSGFENRANIIRNNNIFDFLRPASNSQGIHIAAHSFDWTISDNSLYETTSFSPSGNSRQYYLIRVANTAGNDFKILNNFIGGSAAQCGGTAWVSNPTSNHRFYAIHLSVGTGASSSVQNNTIRNYNFRSTHALPWYGIYVATGNINIGTDVGNTIGSDIGNGSVTVTNTTSNATTYGIYIASTVTINVANNNIGSVTAIGTSALSHSFIAIYKTGAGATTINDNLIGSTETAGSIQAGSFSASSTAQNVYGIQSLGTGLVTISGNTIANMVNSYSPASSTGGQVAGILTSGSGIYTIQNNTIYNFSNTSPNTSTTTTASVIGISAATTGAGKTVSGNIIYNLSNTASSAAVSVIGIYYGGSTTGSNKVNNNFIHSLSLASTSSSAIIAGIRVASGQTSYYNNIISLGPGVSRSCIIYGIYETGTSGNNFTLHFNTIYIGGNPAGNVHTYAYYNHSNTNTRNIRNNILVNSRSNTSGSGKHYAIRLSGTTALTIDFNNYHAPGTGGILGFLTSDQTMLTAWRTATGQDVNSHNNDPAFLNAGSIYAEDYRPVQVLVGTSITGIDFDYLGGTRLNPPSIGAVEINFITSASATFSDGNIFTDLGFQSLPGSSICPALLTVSIPSGATVIGVSVEYLMTAQGGGFMSEQRSQLRCVSPGGTAESIISQGSGTTDGVFSYSRTGLGIANGVSGGGNIIFELHAGRTWGGAGCNATYNYVNNNTWIVTVHYYTAGVFADFEASKTNVLVNEPLTFTDLSGGGNITSWYWNFGDGANPPNASTKGPHNVSYLTAGSKTVSLTINGAETETKMNFISVIPPGDWLHWDDEIYNTAVGLTSAGVFQIATRFEPGDLTTYNSHQITRIRLYIRDLPSSAAMKIWQGPDQLNMVEVYSEAFTPVSNSWVEIALSTPYQLNQDHELWFGAEYTDPGSGYFISGKDQATDYDGKGNLIRINTDDNTAWVTLSSFSIVGDWNLQAYLIPVGLWNGSISNDWLTEGNWSSYLLPLVTTRVTIPPTPNNPEISSDVVIQQLKIQSGASLSINSSAGLAVNGSLINNSGTSGLVIVSDNNGTGSLIHYSDNVPATFQRYISGAAEAWHLLSSPVAAQDISGGFTPPGTYGDGTGYDLYHWHEPDTSWVYFNHQSTWNLTHGNNVFGVGKGYLVAYQEPNPTKNFIGNLNQGEINIPLTKTIGTGSNFGANLAGNPYPSSIDWKAISGWDRSNLLINGGGYDIWIWNDVEYNYGVYNSASSSDEGTLGVTRYIAPSQGFIVNASQTGNIMMSNSVRVHTGADNWLKKTNELPFVLHLTVKSHENNGSDEVMLEFGQSEEVGGIEKKFSFIEKAPSLFIRHTESNFSWLFLEGLENYPVLPVSFVAGANGNYTLSAAFDANYFEMIYLTDLKAKIRHDLKSSPDYNFEAGIKEQPGRFILQFSPGAYGNPHDKLPVNIYAVNRQFFIDLRLVEGKHACEVHDLAGRRLFSEIVDGGQIYEFTGTTNGIVIVKVNGNAGTRSKKILLY